MTSKTRHFWLMFACLLFSKSGFSQIDTTFWFAAPEISASVRDNPIFLRFMSYDDPATIEIMLPEAVNIPGYRSINPFVTMSGKYLYFSSDRPGGEGGHCYDIYEVTNEPITIHTDDKGYYRTELDKHQEIFIKAQKPSFFADAGSVNTKPITETTLLEQDFYLSPIPKDEIELDGIEYDFNSAKLRPKSKQILDELYDFLELNNNLIVEINSHTDSRGSDDYNRKLAERRAKSCVDYLVKKACKLNVE